jgi:hypothetical protein
MMKILSWDSLSKTRYWTRKKFQLKNTFFDLKSFDYNHPVYFPMYLYTESGIHSIESIVAQVVVVDYRPDGMWADFEWFDKTDYGKGPLSERARLAKQAIEDITFYGIKPFGYGKTDENGYVTKFQLRGFAIVPR